MSYSFTLTSGIVKRLQDIERIRETVRLTTLPPVASELLRFQASIRSTHFSTVIEGNRLTLKETEKVVQDGSQFPGRERDVQEVVRYYQALQQLQTWVERRQTITEQRIRRLHAILYSGRRAKPTLYRDGQNVIRDSEGQIVYLPPEAADVPSLMKELVSWMHSAERDLPIPVVAGIAHYQFETIHPFYDGNGRAGRLLTTWILYQGGYDLGGLYALEEFYVQELSSYYDALVTHPHHNYYFGRNEADITPWLEYFLHGMSVVFERLAEVLLSEITSEEFDQETLKLLRSLDHRARRVMGLFRSQEFIRSTEVAQLLGISVRHTRDLLSDWVQKGWLQVADPSKRGRKYALADNYQILLK